MVVVTVDHAAVAVRSNIWQFAVAGTAVNFGTPEVLTVNAPADVLHHKSSPLSVAAGARVSLGNEAKAAAAVTK